LGSSTAKQNRLEATTAKKEAGGGIAGRVRSGRSDTGYNTTPEKIRVLRQKQRERSFRSASLYGDTNKGKRIEGVLFHDQGPG